MNIGILRETKTPVDTRVPLTPVQCRVLAEEFTGISVFIQPSDFRCYQDNHYKKEGAVVTEDLSHCDILLGIKEVDLAFLIPDKTYFFFSHTIKKQNHNRKLLRAVLDKHIRLVDYEMLTDNRGIRIIGFGRWAGLIGTYLGIRAMALRLGLQTLPLPQQCENLKEMMKIATSVHLPPLKIAITGDGRVSGGSEEMMTAFGVQKVTVNEYLEGGSTEGPVYVQLDPEKYNKRTDRSGFELQHFFAHPDAYGSDFARFCPVTDLLIMAAYWDPRAPRLFTNEQMKEKNFRIRAIADITCDLNGSVPSTVQTTNFQEPYYDFNPKTLQAEKAFSNDSNITVMSIDNLPCGLPRESSEDFGHNILKNIIPLFTSGDPEQILERATIARNGQLTPNFTYLSHWVMQPL